MQTADMPSEIKKSSGMAFELVFKEPSKDAVKSPIQSPPKPSSLDDINKKLEAAKDRREQQARDLKDQLAKKHSLIPVAQAKVEEDNEKFKKEAEEKLQVKNKKAQDLQLAQEEARIQKQNQAREKAEKVHARKKEIGESEETNTADSVRSE